MNLSWVFLLSPSVGKSHGIANCLCGFLFDCEFFDGRYHVIYHCDFSTGNWDHKGAAT